MKTDCTGTGQDDKGNDEAIIDTSTGFEPFIRENDPFKYSETYEDDV